MSSALDDLDDSIRRRSARRNRKKRRRNDQNLSNYKIDGQQKAVSWKCNGLSGSPDVSESSVKKLRIEKSVLESHFSVPILHLASILTGAFKCVNESDDQSALEQVFNDSDIHSPRSPPSITDIGHTVKQIVVNSQSEDSGWSSDSCVSNNARLRKSARRLHASRSHSVPDLPTVLDTRKPNLQRLESLRLELRRNVSNVLLGLNLRNSISKKNLANTVLSDWRVQRTLLRIEKDLHTVVRLEPQSTVLRDLYYPLTANDLYTIVGSDENWLNDAVINAYLSLLVTPSASKSVVGQSSSTFDRPSRSPVRVKSTKVSDHHRAARIYAFNSFMFTKLCQAGYDGVRRWTKKANLFADYDIVLFPINLPAHWTLAVADLRKRSLRFYDSLISVRLLKAKFEKESACILRTLFDYLANESLSRNKVKLNPSEWQIGVPANVKSEEHTLQRNGSDCGVFVCKYAEAIARDATLRFDAEEVMNSRRQLLCELLLRASFNQMSLSPSSTATQL